MKRLSLSLVMLFTCSLLFASIAGASDNVLVMTDIKTNKIYKKMAKLDLEDEKDLEKGKKFVE